MLEMLKARKEQLQAEGKKGFTLMEMLIVIAIIAILIAIAIPIFTNQLNAAKAATDEANGRALYAQLQADYMLDEIDEGFTGGAIAANATIVYGGTTYKFSDVLESGSTINVTGEPGVKIVTNGKTFTFGNVS